MMSRIKNLISAVERLGLDTQPLRDLITIPRQNYKDYSSKLDNLEREVTLHPPGSQPHQVEILVSNLLNLSGETGLSAKKNNSIIMIKETEVKEKESLNADLMEEVVSSMAVLMEKLAQYERREAAREGGNDSSKVMEKLEDLASKVENITFISGSESRKEDLNMPKISEAFVNPIDENEVKKISGSIQVTPEKGKSLTSSLQKLRGLKESGKE